MGTAEKPANANYKYPLERRALLEMVKRDQKVRKGDLNKVEIDMQMSHINYANYKRLLKILDRIGLPSTENVGLDGSKAAWLVAQHSYFDIAFMERMLELLEKITTDNPKGGYREGIPYLKDRISLLKGEKQHFGTQLWGAPNGTDAVVYPIADAKNVNKRRRRFGLKPLDLK